MNQSSNFRSHFDLMPGLTHLNNAGLSPMNLRSEAVIHHWASRYRAEGMFCNDAYLEAVDAARGQLARFLDADPGEIALFQSVANAISQVAFELGLKPQDEVLMWDQEYGSHLYPWQAACQKTGATLRLVESEVDFSTPVEKFLASITDRTRVLAVSWVQFQTGAVCDLAPLVEAAKKRDIWVVVDGFQGVGILPLSFKSSGIDVLVGGAHKWMCSAVGVGYLCIKKSRALQLPPHNIGAYTYGTCDDPTDLSCTPKRDALRFEAGSKQVLEIVALGAAAELIQELGVAKLHGEAIAFAESLANGLRALGFHLIESNQGKRLSPIINFTPSPKQSGLTLEKVGHALEKAKISFARRGPGIRLSPHAHNQASDIDYCLSVLSQIK